MKTIILGLGNISYRDDGAGIVVARAIKSHAGLGDVVVAEATICGLDILEIIAGYDTAILIDAIQTENGTPGSVLRLSPDLLSALHESSFHRINYLTAIELGKKIGLNIPPKIVIFGIEAKDILTPGEDCTEEIKKAIPVCVNMIVRELAEESCTA